MKVTIRLVLPEPVLPAAFDREGTARLDLPDGASLATGLAGLGLERLGNYLTLLDGHPVVPEERAARPLHDGAEVVVLPPMEGGRRDSR